MKTVLGIDPGLTGGLAVIHDGQAILATPMPLAGKDIDLGHVAHLIASASPSLIVIEKVHAMPKQGVSSTFKFGEGFGAMKGIAAAMGIRLELVTPQAWMKLVLAGGSKDKTAAIDYVRRAYPDVELIRKGCRVPHSGVADAVCIAEWGRRVLC